MYMKIKSTVENAHTAMSDILYTCSRDNEQGVMLELVHSGEMQVPNLSITSRCECRRCWQELKESLVAYFTVMQHGSRGVTADELDLDAEKVLVEVLAGEEIDFEVDDALRKARTVHSLSRG